jgi:hypothetical protein
MSETTITDLEIRGKLARIDQLNADAARRRQAFELGYRTFWVSAVTAAAVLLGGGAALGAFITKLFT